MEITRKPFWKRCDMTERDRRNQWKVLAWLAMWTITWLAASLAIKSGWVSAGTPATIAALLPLVPGLLLLVAFSKFLRQADELQRKIQLDALALGFGAGLIGTIAYQLLERAGVILETDVSDIAVLMMVVYAYGVIAGQRRYA